MKKRVHYEGDPMKRSLPHRGGKGVGRYPPREHDLSKKLCAGGIAQGEEPRNAFQKKGKSQGGRRTLSSGLDLKRVLFSDKQREGTPEGDKLDVWKKTRGEA